MLVPYINSSSISIPAFNMDNEATLTMKVAVSFFIKCSFILTQGAVLSEALSIKQVIPTTHMLVPYALEKISAISIPAFNMDNEATLTMKVAVSFFIKCSFMSSALSN
jgi:predicted 3-demethylubiquinone-9 3-methyltransferase (glyoxalase superfamily)